MSSSVPAQSPHTVEVALTESAATALKDAGDLYAQTVVAQARVYSARAEVVGEHVERAVRQLSPAYEANGIKVLLDWVKRVGFLIVGIALVQTGQLINDIATTKATTGQAILVVVLLVVSLVLIVAAGAMDVPALLNWRNARRVRKQIEQNRLAE